MNPSVVVSAAVVIRDGCVLLTQRRLDRHLGGLWEFPGGKVEPDEDPRDALARELSEELGVVARAGNILEVTFHRYPSKRVLLLFFEATLEPDSPEPRALDAAGLKWATASDLENLEFPPADIAVVGLVRELLGASATRM